jgi:hypothetical protein
MTDDRAPYLIHPPRPMTEFIVDDALLQRACRVRLVIEYDGGALIDGVTFTRTEDDQWTPLVKGVQP